MTLFGLIAFASFVNGWHLMASVAASLSLLSKFHGIYLSGIFFLAYLYIFLREKRWQPLVVFLLLLGLTLIWYQVHWTTVEKRYPEILTEDPSKTGSEFMIGWSGSSKIISRLNWMCNFVGDIYTHFEFYASVFVPLGLLGFMLPLLYRRLRQTLHLPLLIGIAWSIGFCLLIGMLEWSCQYWGVQIMPVALLGFTVGCLTLIYALEGNRFQEPLIKG
jgi:4-amino-4-deoxy-L-arabinose transferase-like glycosyltransferase